MARGVIDRTRIEAELADLVGSRKVGRLNDNEITLFKSVGVALEDLAAAQYVLAASRKVGDKGPHYADRRPSAVSLVAMEIIVPSIE